MNGAMNLLVCNNTCQLQIERWNTKLNKYPRLKCDLLSTIVCAQRFYTNLTHLDLDKFRLKNYSQSQFPTAFENYRIKQVYMIVPDLKPCNLDYFKNIFSRLKCRLHSTSVNQQPM